MEEKIDSIIKLAGSQNRYQYFTLLLTFLMWVNVDLLPISLPLFEKYPEIDYKDTSTGQVISTQFNYTMCSWPKENYTITKIYKHSWVSEFHIECDKLLIGLIGSLTFAGVLTGSLFLKLFSDGIGRKKTVLLGGIGYTTTFLIFLFSRSIYVNLVLCFVGCFFSYLNALGSYVLVSESVSSELRGVFGSIIMSGFSVCGILYALVYKYLQSWRLVFIISASTTYLFMIIFYCISLESPIYYIYKKDYKKFLETCVNIAKFNGRSDKFLKDIRNDGKKHKQDLIEIEDYLNIKPNEINRSYNDNQKSFFSNNKIHLLLNDNTYNSQSESIITPHSQNIIIKKKLQGISALLCVSQIRWKFLILCNLWFITSANYYGLTINLKNLKGDIYINNIINYSFEAFSYFFVGYVMNQKWGGRKKTVLFLYFMAIIIFISFSVFKFDGFVSDFMIFSAKFAFAGLFNTLYTFSLEIYPTCVRVQGFGINSASARVASIIFPILIEILGGILNIVFLVLNIIGFVMVLFLPETLGRPLKHEIEEEEKKDCE